MEMNKLFLVVVLLILPVLNLQASAKKDEWQPMTYIYQSSSTNPTQVIKTDCKTGQQEIIPVSPGKTGQQKAEELMMLEAMAWIEFQKQRNKSKK
jgi:hypothetical protein